ncbi:MAG: hypothetical protein HQL33_01930 [Alphaproteobacteria bacterium]|nr:hypothetical protein [Alphaproteobacteria bacterium]
MVVVALTVGCAEPDREQPSGPTSGPLGGKSENRETAPADATIGQVMETPGDAKSVEECRRIMAPLAVGQILGDARAMHAQRATTTTTVGGVNQSLDALTKQTDLIRMRDDIEKMKDLTSRLSAMSACVKKRNSVGVSGEK